MRIGEDGPYRHGTYVRTAVQGKKGNLKPGTTKGGMPPGGLFMTRNVGMASRYPMLLEWEEGEVPYPGCFPVRMVLTLSCTEVRTVRRSRGQNQFWLKNYQSRGIITRRATRGPNKARVMRTIMHQVGYLKPTTAAALGERAGSPRPPGFASDVGTLLEDLLRVGVDQRRAARVMAGAVVVEWKIGVLLSGS